MGGAREGGAAAPVPLPLPLPLLPGFPRGNFDGDKVPSCDHTHAKV